MRLQGRSCGQLLCPALDPGTRPSGNGDVALQEGTSRGEVTDAEVLASIILIDGFWKSEEIRKAPGQGHPRRQGAVPHGLLIEGAPGHAGRQPAGCTPRPMRSRRHVAHLASTALLSGLRIVG